MEVPGPKSREECVTRSPECFRLSVTTWTAKIGKIMALRAILRGLGLSFYILLVFR